MVTVEVAVAVMATVRVRVTDFTCYMYIYIQLVLVEVISMVGFPCLYLAASNTGLIDCTLACHCSFSMAQRNPWMRIWCK